jgi:hypothetical protein
LRWNLTLLCRRRLVFVALVVGACHGAVASPTLHLDFRVTLDGRPIGEHRFTVTGDRAQREVRSSAHYEVKLFGVTVYRYAHEAQELWLDDCLTRLDALTDDDGSRTEIQGHADATGFAWQVRRGSGTALPGRSTCPMSFAYWNPAIAQRSTLLDPGSGRLESVSFQALPPSTIDVHGSPTAVRGLRLLGLPHAIDLWYRGDDWVGLDTTVTGGRHLRYRLP